MLDSAEHRYPVAAQSGAGSSSDADRILIVTRNLPPLTGGMERLNWHLAQELAQRFRVRLCGPSGSRQKSPDNAPVIKTFAARPLPRFLVESLAVTLSAAVRFRPALVIAGSGVTAPHAWLAGRFTGARTLVYLHGLDLIAHHPLYRALFLPAIRHADRLLVNSRNTARLAREAGIAAERISILHPGVTLAAECANPGPDAFRRAIGAEDRPILLSVGRLTARKGLLEFVRHALPAIVAVHPSVLLVVIGGEASERLGACREGQSDAIRREAKRLGLANHLRLLGRVDDEVLEQAYRASRIHIFPVMDLPGDVEGFGMVAIEAASQGLPTVAFAAGGVPDAVAPGVSGLLVPPGDYPALALAIVDVLEGRHAEIDANRCRDFASGFAWASFGECARRICGIVINGGIAMGDRRRSPPPIGTSIEEVEMSSQDPAATHRQVADFYDEVYYQKDADQVPQPSRHLQRLAARLVHPGQQILDVACGRGEWLAAVSERDVRVSGIDISKCAIETCRKYLPQGHFEIGPAESLPFPDNHFDLVTCLGSLEHFLDQPAALKEMVRVVHPGGRVLVLVPNAGFLTYRLGFFRGTQQQTIRETIRPLSEWSAMLNTAGLQVIERWKDLHVLNRSWIFRPPHSLIPVRLAQALALLIWPLSWQYQVYHLCHISAGEDSRIG